MLEIKDYTLYRNDRQWGDVPERIKKGGGPRIYIGSNFNVSEFAFQHLNDSSQHIESQWLCIDNKNIIIANCYLPPVGDISFYQIGRKKTVVH